MVHCKFYGGRGSIMRHLLVALILLAILCPSAFAQARGSSPSSAAPAGETITGIISCGEGYTSHELYDVKLTLKEVIRGEEAWKRLQAADTGNTPAPAGMEYLLALVRFEYYARGVPGLCVHKLLPDHFTAYSAAGEDYKQVPVVPPRPKLRQDLKSGDSFEGWLVFAVAADDNAPLMSYSAESGGAVQHGESQWFVLR